MREPSYARSLLETQASQQFVDLILAGDNVVAFGGVHHRSVEQAAVDFAAYPGGRKIDQQMQQLLFCSVFHPAWRR